MPDMIGSFEERQTQLREAISDLLLPDRDGDGDNCAPGQWVCIEATYPDRVICTVTCGDDQDSYELPYEFTPEGEVSLGMPSPVKLSVVATPDEGDEPGGEADDDEAVIFRFLAPAADSLSDALSYVMAAPAGTEGKAFDAVRVPLLRLLDGLAVKGMDMTGVAGAQPAVADADPDADGDTAAVDTDGHDDDPWKGLLDPEPAAAPAPVPAPAEQAPAEAAPAPALEGAPSGDVVHLDPEQVKAELAGLQEKSDDEDMSDSDY